MLTFEKVMILRSLEIFSRTPEEQLIEVAAALKLLQLPAETPLIARGTVGSTMFIVIRGTLRVHVGEQDIAVIGARETVGEMGALDGEPRSSDVTTREACDLFELDGDILFDMMSEHVEIARGIIQVLCGRLRTHNQDK
jgi:CRP-like cAMP-binding protein